MKKYYSAICLVESNGRLPEGIGIRVRDALKMLAGKQVQISLSEPKRYSTDPQRQYYFGVIVVAFQNYFVEQGHWYDKDELHELMMTEIGNFWKEKINPFTEKTEKTGRLSYSDLSVQQAENYHLLCRAWAAQTGFDIPEPNEQKKEKSND